MKKNKNIIMSLAAVSSISLFSACTSVGEHQSSPALYYTNLTQADTEEYDFLRAVYELTNNEIDFGNKVAEREASSNVKDLAAQVNGVYTEILEKLVSLSNETSVLIPHPAYQRFELSSALDSSSVNNLEHVYLETSLHNQETVVNYFKSVEGSTTKSINRYASEMLPTLEENLEKTRALL